MSDTMSPIDQAKFVAARKACAFVEDGMTVGFGTGSTAAWMLRGLAEREREEGLDVTGVATSERSAELARELGLDLVDLNDVGRVDLTIDGADEIDGALDLLKGGGGALLREKIVAAASDRMVVIADGGKQVATLGAFPLPVEVVRFGWRATRELIRNALMARDLPDQKVVLRMAGDAPFVTDNGNHVLDLDLGRIDDARELARALPRIPGVVETGLFVDICDTVVIGHGDGRVELRSRRGPVSEEGSAPGMLVRDLGE